MEKWSSPWGGSDYQWWGSIYLRVMPFLPAGTIVEIATGHGRWSQYLLRFCERFIGIDLVESCARACRERFPDEHAEFHTNDGVSLPAVADEGADFIFSFDSLVHAEMEVMRSYLAEIARTLSPDGVAFIHHSNLAGQKVAEEHWRAPSVNAELVSRACQLEGLSCVRQELLPWGGTDLTDCLSLITRPRLVMLVRARRMRITPSARRRTGLRGSPGSTANYSRPSLR